MSNQKSEQEIREEDERRRKSEEKDDRKSSQKKKKEKKKEKNKKKLERDVIDDVGINIPILELEKPKIVLKEMVIDKEIPEIEEEDRELNIPIIIKEKSKVDLKNNGFDNNIPRIKPSDSNLIIPFIKLTKSRQVRVKENFNDRLPQIRPKKIKAQQIPKYNIEVKKEVRTKIFSFDNSINDLLSKKHSGLREIEKIEEKLKKTTQNEQVTEVLVENDEDIPSEGLENHGKLPDIINFIFNISNRELSGSKRPKLVLYKELEIDSTIGFFTTICLKIMREKGILNPKILPMKKLDPFNKKEITKYINADRKIIIIDLGDYDKDIKDSKVWFIKDNLMELIRKFIHGEFGLIIFKTRSPNLYKYCEKVLTNLEKEVENIVDIVYLEPNFIENKKELIALVWGNLELEDIDDTEIEYDDDLERLTGMGILDDINKKAQAKYEQILENLEEENEGLYINATNPHDNEESDEHKQLKWFLIKVLTIDLVKNGVLPKEPYSDKIREIIETESEDKGVIADVKYKNSVYEVETFFTQDVEGKKPTEKLNYTINKYEKDVNVKINIILENLTLLRHLKKIISVWKQKSKERSEKIEFFTLDLQNNKLISLSKIIKRLKNIQNKNSLIKEEKKNDKVILL